MEGLKLSPEITGPHSLAGCNGNSHVEAQETEDFFPWIRKHNASSGQGSSRGPELQLTCPVTLARDCDFSTEVTPPLVILWRKGQGQNCMPTDMVFWLS